MRLMPTLPDAVAGEAEVRVSVFVTPPTQSKVKLEPLGKLRFSAVVLAFTAPSARLKVAAALTCSVPVAGIFTGSSARGCKCNRTSEDSGETKTEEGIACGVHFRKRCAVFLGGCRRRIW